MKVLSRIGFVVVAFLVASTLAQAEDAGPLATVEAFHAALGRGDRDAALNLLSEKVQVYEQGHVEQSRAAYASEHLDADIDYAKAVKSDVSEVTVEAGSQIALVARQSRSHGKFRDKDVDSFGLETMVLQRIDGAWKIVHIHWSSRKAKN